MKSGEFQILIRAFAAALCLAAAMCTLLLFCIQYPMRHSDCTTASAEVPEVTLIAAFSTYYGDSSENRKHNVALAAQFIDGTVVLPEDEFSFNETVGARTEQRGFKPAYIISDGTFVEGIGGGVCQVSSTLYNCALLADLYITCVRPHSLPVSYVAPSFDAMVSSASDLRFANTLSAPITVKMKADGKYIRAEIYGVSGGLSVRRRSETLGTIPNETQYIDDDTLAAGEEVIDTYGKNGIKSEGWLEYYRDGVMIKCVRIRRDTYKPQNRIILRGVASPEGDNIPSETDAPSGVNVPAGETPRYPVLSDLP